MVPGLVLGNDTEETEHVDTLSEENDDAESGPLSRLAAHMAQRVKQSNGCSRHAVKRLNPEVKVALYDDTITDLTIEAMYGSTSGMLGL